MVDASKAVTAILSTCGALAPPSIDPAQHRHLCGTTRKLADPTRREFADLNTHTHNCPCGYAWADLSPQDRELFAALESQLTSLRLAGLRVENVSVVVEDSATFAVDKRRFRITGDLVHIEPEASDAQL